MMKAGHYLKWRAGTSAKVDAETAYNELERIRSGNNGDLTVDIVVEAARPKGAPLHPQIFDRSQAMAAAEYYKQRARETMNGIVEVYSMDDSEDSEVVEVRVFSTVEDVPSKSRGRTTKVYSSTEEALMDPMRREYVLAEALRQLAVFRKKYAALSELACVFHAIDEIAA